MLTPVLESAIGSVDGFNTSFQTSNPYAPGSIRVWLNGQLKQPDLDDGYNELGGSSFAMLEAPVTGDVLQVFYMAL